MVIKEEVSIKEEPVETEFAEMVEEQQLQQGEAEVEEEDSIEFVNVDNAEGEVIQVDNLQIRPYKDPLKVSLFTNTSTSGEKMDILTGTIAREETKEK